VRVFVRLISALLGLAGAVLGALVALEVAWHWWRPAGAPLLVPWPYWRDTLSHLTWNADTVRITAGIVAGAGLVLLLAAAIARPRAIRLHDPAPGVSATTSPRSLARLVGHAVRAQDNVVSASVTASARRVRVRATSRLEREEELRPRLLEVVTGLVNDLPLVRVPKVSVVVDSPKDRR
jgi:hypothetical protein